MRKTYSVKYFLSFFGACILGTSFLFGQILFPVQSSFKYLKGSEAASLSSNWMDPGFNDGSWQTGNAPFWYGDGVGGTEITDMRYSYLTFYMRSTFQASNIPSIQEISFNVNYDDGFIIWVNGKEVLNVFAPVSHAYNDSATTLHESGAFEEFTLSIFDIDLVEGTNTVAIQGFNYEHASSDFHFNMSIDAALDIPVLVDTIGVTYSHASGYYDNPFTLTITSPDPTANLAYTIDGSNPQESATVITAGTSATIFVDPSNTSGRGATPGFIVRAALSKTGLKPSYPSGRTYIFWDALKNQTYPGDNWPSGDVQGVFVWGVPQVIDYDMDPDVINDSRYSDKIEEAFLDVPTLAINTSVDNLFGVEKGIYVNAGGHGSNWERECTFELFDPSGSEEGFSVNAGVRIRGGYSRHGNYPKHAFRIFFRSEYGEAKLRYPLFGDEGVDTYDKIDVRTSQNYAWSGGSDANTMVREVFSRDMQRDMGRPYTRSRYYHLFLNGMYWGLFQTQERAEARFASDYFGDSSEDYDVIKVGTDGYVVEATDGTIDKWEDIYNDLQGGYENNEDYFRLEGKDSEGNPVPGGEKLVDIDNLIDYMIGIFYTGNFDAPTSPFSSNKGANNFYAIVNKDDKDKGFMFFNHDAEHSLFYYQHWPGIGIQEDRVNIGTLTGDWKMENYSLTTFHPQWLHFKLSANEEYRIRFADRAVMFLSQGGELTPEKCAQRFSARASQIEKAIIGESARWGDGIGSYLKTKDDHWDYEIEHMISQFFPVRTDITINQLKYANLYPSVDAPEIYRNANLLTAQEYDINPGWIISLENPNSGGTLYYSMDGTDPRKIGGDIYSSALQGNSQNVMTLGSSTIITSRIYDNGNWSGLKQIKFFASQEDDLNNLKITEIHYHPEDLIEGTDTISGKDFEFIEFKNIGPTALNLSGITIDSAVYYQFPENTLLGPGQFYVVISKPSGFFKKYGEIGDGNYKGSLANSGEKILVTDAQGDELILFTYDDHNPWPELPDGDGPSMVSVETNPTGDPVLAGYWRASHHIDGSPFADDLIILGIDETFASILEKPTLTVFPNPTSGELNLELSNWSWDKNHSIKLYQLDGQLVYESEFENGETLNINSFGIHTGLYIIKVEVGKWTYTRKIIYTP